MRLLLVDDDSNLLDAWTMTEDPDVLQGVMDALPDGHPTKALIAAAYVEGRLDEPEEPAIDDSVQCCPDCETPTQFGELCRECQAEHDLVGSR